MTDIRAKLGWKMGMTAVLRNCPPELEAALQFPLPAGGVAPHLVIAFVAQAADVAPALEAVLPHYRHGQKLWLCYPKKSGTIRSDLTRDQGWDALKPHDLLGVSQIALDETWSALRFRYRDEIARLTRTGQ